MIPNSLACLFAAMYLLLTPLDSTPCTDSPHDQPDQFESALVQVRPLVAIYQDPGYVRRTRDINLELAIWTDGTVLIAPDRDNLNDELTIYTLPKALIEKLQTQLLEDGLFEDGVRKEIVARDAYYKSIYLHVDNKTTNRKWDELIAPGWGANVHPTPEYRDFVSRWINTKITLINFGNSRTAEPLDEGMIDKGSFRGLSLDSALFNKQRL